MEENVKVNQIWNDNDPRRQGRTFKVESITNGKAKCKVLTHKPNISIRKKFVRIRLERFKPKRNGYTLVKPIQTIDKIVTQPVKLDLDEPINHLFNECKRLLPGNWKLLNPNTVRLDNNRVSIVLRGFSSGYDVKGLIEDHILCSMCFVKNTGLSDIFKFVLQNFSEIIKDLIGVVHE